MKADPPDPAQIAFTAVHWWLLGTIVALVVLAALFAAAEVALSRISSVRVTELGRSRPRAAVRLQQVVADPPRYLNTVLLLRLCCEMVAAVLVTLLALRLLPAGWIPPAVAAASMVVLSYVGIGVAPRTLARQHPDRVALASAVWIVPLTRVLGPLPKLLILIGNALTPGKGFAEGPFASEAELRELVDLASKSKVIEDNERRMVHSVFELGDTLARSVMVPRPDMVYIERCKTLRQALSLALRSGFSRIPVVGENADDVLGIVYVKDLVRRVHDHHEAESVELVESVMRPATFVPDSKPVDELLRDMQSHQNHLVVVVDEYGGTAGLVTIEDILEEIVGEIADEYDVERPLVEELPDGAVRVSARLGLDELAEIFGFKLDAGDVEDVDTVGGLLAKHLGRVPIPGAQVEVAGVSLTAESTAGRRNRIDTVLARRATAEQPPAEQPEPTQARESAEAGRATS